MHDTVTVGMIVYPILAIFGLVVVLGVLGFILWIVAQGFNH